MGLIDVLPYQRDLVALLQESYPSVWRRVEGADALEEQAQGHRLALLREALPIEREDHPLLYEDADSLRDAMGMTVPVEIYRGPDLGSLNAVLVYLPETATIVFHGDIEGRLERAQMRALLAHELAHHELRTRDGGLYATADRCVRLMASTGESAACNSARLFMLHAEVYCDRVALNLTGFEATAQLLLRVRLGVSAGLSTEKAIARAERAWAEFGSGKATTHPESWVRLLLLKDWKDGADPAAGYVLARLRDSEELQGLDLVGRAHIDRRTRGMIAAYLEPEYMRSETLLGYARFFFEEEEFSEPSSWDSKWLEGAPQSIRTYVTAVFLDFALADPELEHVPAQRAHKMLEEAGMAHEFEKALKNFARQSNKTVAEMFADRDAALERAELQDDE